MRKTMNKIERLRTWKESDYFKAKRAIFENVMRMEQENRHKTNKEEYNKLLNEYQKLNDEYEELKRIEKKTRKEAKKRINKLWKEQEDQPMKSFILYVC